MHEVIEGAADKSYGIHVAELAGLPQKVIERAKESLKKEASQQTKGKQLADIPCEESNLLKFLRSIKPDDLSPRQALQALYELKEYANKGQNRNTKPDQAKASLFGK